MIETNNVVVTRNGNRILNGISLKVNKGEVTALVGPSGGGKSTLLRCLNGLQSFDSGDVTVAGHSLKGGQPTPRNTLLALRRNVGMVFQQFNLFPHFTVLQNVMAGPLYALNTKRAEAETTALALLDRVGLSAKAKEMPANLSGGQQQRVAIARALAVKPQAILFDEPTSALDPTMAREVLAVMRDLAREGQTMVVVTHDMDFAKQSTVVHVLEGGAIVKSGTPDEVLNEI